MEEVKNYSEHDIEEKSRSTDVIEDEKYFWHTSVENEAKNCLSKRSMYFKDKSIKEKFKRLSPEYQECIKKVIFTLSKGNDFLGKNLKNIIDAFGNIAPKENMTSYAIANIIVSGDENETERILNTLTQCKKGAHLRTKGFPKEIIERMCEFYMIDLQFLELGYGKITIINPEYISYTMTEKENIEQDIKDIQKRLKNKLGEKSEEENILLNIDVSKCDSLKKWLKVLEICLKYKKQISNPLLIEHYAIMKENSQFEALNKKEKEAVKLLMDDLYLIQENATVD